MVLLSLYPYRISCIQYMNEVEFKWPLEKCVKKLLFSFLARSSLNTNYFIETW